MDSRIHRSPKARNSFQPTTLWSWFGRDFCNIGRGDGSPEACFVCGTAWIVAGAFSVARQACITEVKSSSFPSFGVFGCLCFLDFEKFEERKFVVGCWSSNCQHTTWINVGHWHPRLNALPAPLVAAPPVPRAELASSPQHALQVTPSEEPTLSRPSGDQEPREKPVADAAARLWLVASGVSFEDVMVKCPGFKGFQEPLPAAFDADDFCEGLLHAIDGLTGSQAAYLVDEARCGQRSVSLDLWKGVLRETSSCVEAAMDLLQLIAGEELGWLVEQLAAMGHISLQHTQLVSLLAHKCPSTTWGLMDEFLRLLDPDGQGVPARPIAKLLSKRAEAYWRSQMQSPSERPTHGLQDQLAHKPDLPDALEQDSFVAPESLAARQLISALLCLIRAGEFHLDEVVGQLDAAAIWVSERKPALWCAPLAQPATIAGILEGDREGTCRALQLWQSLHLPTSASAAVMALRSLSTLEHTSGQVRLRAENPIRSLAQDPQISNQPSTRDVFQALLSIAFGPEQLRSRLRTACGTVGPNHVHLDQFTSALQRAGVIMASADLLEAHLTWWTWLKMCLTHLCLLSYFNLSCPTQVLSQVG